MLWLRALFFTLIAPFVVAGLLPYRLVRGQLDRPLALTSPAGALGVLATVLGIIIYLWCAADFVRKGHGTPAPYDPPRKLVRDGLYRFVRNPMYVGVLTTILGEAALLRSRTLFTYAGLVFLLFHFRVLWYEEPVLLRLFGDDYGRYCAEVSRWLPRMAMRRSPVEACNTRREK